MTPVEEIRATLSSLGARVRALFAHAQANGLPVAIVFGNASDSGLDDATFQRNVLAIAVWLQTLVAPAWGIAPPSVEAVPTGAPPPPDPPGVVTVRLQVKASIPEAPGAAGYHEPTDPSEPWDGYVATAGLDAAGLTECMAHEAGEGEIDAPCTLTATAPNGDIYPKEICDAVQGSGSGDRVAIDLGDGKGIVWCSNFVLPAYFEPRTSEATQEALAEIKSRGAVQTHALRVDYLGLLPGPFTIGPNGYSAITKADGSTTDVYGQNGERVALPARKLHPECRIQARLAAMRATQQEAA